MLNGQVSKKELVQAQAALAKAQQSEIEARAEVEELRRQQNRFNRQLQNTKHERNAARQELKTRVPRSELNAVVMNRNQWSENLKKARTNLEKEKETARQRQNSNREALESLRE
eukprot:6864125-Pyramimonas_sp.AAC.1